MYINDFSKLNYVETGLYVDDTAVYGSSYRIDTIKK